MSIQNNNFFALFDLPIDFLIDKNTLKNRFLALQKKYHPDNSQTNDAETNASLINHAYNILICDDRRAIYLLELANVDAQIGASIDDSVFLGEMMEVRMDLEDANTLTDVITLQTVVDEKLAYYCQAFYQAYQQKNWQIAVQNAQKLHFLSNLRNSIPVKQSSFNQSDDIDDLYV